MNEIPSFRRRNVALSEEIALREGLSRFIGNRLRDQDAREDIVQETYLRYYVYAERRSVANVAALCYAIARNLMHDHFRRMRAAPPSAALCDTIACDYPRADSVLDYRQRVTILVQALRAMPPLRREIFLRRRLDDMPIAIIAADLEMSRAAIEKHCTRAVADLRFALEQRGLPAGARP